MTGELTEAEKKILSEGMGKAMGDALKESLPAIVEEGRKAKAEYIERLTRIETKLDILISQLKLSI